MCTVSFIPLKEKVFITSNRDEKAWRLPAQAPKQKYLSNCEMIFPTDSDAGGSWISLCENGNAGVLLNGAYSKHERKENYRKSRGLIFLEIMDNKRPLHHFVKKPLEGIEAFTLIIWQEKSLYECRHDADGKKYVKNLPAYRPYIWSSATLYDEEVRKRREQWFLKWLNNHPTPSQQDILNFHRFAGDGDKKNDLFMNRDGKVFTVSITSIRLDGKKSAMYYTDLIKPKSVEHHLHFSHSLIAA